MRHQTDWCRYAEFKVWHLKFLMFLCFDAYLYNHRYGACGIKKGRCDKKNKIKKSIKCIVMRWNLANRNFFLFLSQRTGILHWYLFGYRMAIDRISVSYPMTYQPTWQSSLNLVGHRIQDQRLISQVNMMKKFVMYYQAQREGNWNKWPGP